MANPWEEYQPSVSDGPWSDYAPTVSKVDKIVKGMVDPIEGGAQLLTHILPQGVVDAGNSVNNWLADKTGLVAHIPTKMDALVNGKSGFDGLVQNNENAYQAKRAAAGESGFDGYRMLGNVLSPANAAVGARAATLTARPLANAVISGATTSALSPVAEGDYLTEKAKQVATGAVGGALVHGAASGVARVISPNASVNPQLQLLRQEGVRPTIGQSLGGWANRAEEKLQSVPIVGDAIQSARNSAGEDLSRAAINRSLAPIGAELPAGVVGNDAILFARRTLGDAYDSVLPNMAVRQDPQFANAALNLRGMVNNGAIGNGTRAQFNRFINNEVNPLFQGQQSMTGETFKRLQSKVTEQIKNTQASTNADERLLSTAYRELGDQLNQLSVRTNPQLAPALTAINRGYANFKRVQRAGSSVAAEDGSFNPAQLHNAVKAMDKSKDKARFSEGNALMQDLSAAGKNLLSNKVPNSGTVDRLLLGGGALASGFANPAIPAGLLLGAGAYTSPIQSLLRGMVASRPNLAQPVANAVRQTSPYLTPIGGNGVFGLLQ
jgi:hypothetical protein